MQSKFNEDYFQSGQNLNKRLDMWYDYIEAAMEKARGSTHIFGYLETIENIGDMLCIRVDGAEDCQVKNLSAGIADENGEPAFAFGKAEKLENGVLTVRTYNTSEVSLKEHETRIAIYDAAATITYRRMKNGLDKLCRGESVNKRLMEFLFDPMAANLETGENITLSADDLLMKDMNPEQIAAVEGALNAHDMYLIQGPPGTGKTTVIAEICYQNAVRGLKTLIVSQSNLAVDNAISRVMNHAEVRALRKGDVSRVEDEGLPFVEDNVVHTWIERVSASAGETVREIDKRLETLKKYKDKLPEVLRYAEDVVIDHRNRSRIESQMFFCKNVLEEADSKRKIFFELINSAYEENDPEKAYAAREYYPDDFRIPNGIYNDISEEFADIEADSAKIRQFETELEMLSGYTAKFSKQMRFIARHVSENCLENIAYEGKFHYIDSNLADDLYSEGERIVNSIPRGINALVLHWKWERTASIHYRRAESFIYGIQRRTIRLAEKITSLMANAGYSDVLETFRMSLDALCQDYDAQYCTVKGKYNDMCTRLENAVRECEYSEAVFKEKTSDKFFSAALEGLDCKIPELDAIEKAVNEYYSKKTRKYLKWSRLLKEWRSAISENRVDHNSLKRLYIDNANVIGITCIQSGTLDFERNYSSFDAVIIDESSKSTLPDIIIPMLRGRKIILVGDHKQLPPYIDSDAYDEIENDGEGIRELMKISLFEELYETAPTEMKTMLFRQYRMHRNIAAMVNHFYADTDAGRLESPSDAPKEHCCQGGDIDEENHVLWYDVKNVPDNYEEKRGKSFCNKSEVECIRNILSLLDRNLLAHGARRTIGVITFYDAQVRLLEEKLIESGFADSLSAASLRIGTVDRFQGMEEDIIIVSFVRNNAAHNIGFAKDSRRINVALSRAKELLIIIGSSENFIGSENDGAAEMFGDLYNIAKRLDGIRNPELLERARFSSGAAMKKINGNSSVYLPETYSEDLPEDKTGMNILDIFIMRAAYEFDGTRLSVGNIASALGVAPIFVKNRTASLSQQGYLSCTGEVIRLLDDGKNFAKKFFCGNLKKINERG